MGLAAVTHRVGSTAPWWCSARALAASAPGGRHGSEVVLGANALPDLDGLTVPSGRSTNAPQDRAEVRRGRLQRLRGARHGRWRPPRTRQALRPRGRARRGWAPWPEVAGRSCSYPVLRSGRFGSPQGPKKNQIQWTVLDSPGRKATPIFRGKTGRAACVPSRDQIRLHGFDSRRLHLKSPAILRGKEPLLLRFGGMGNEDTATAHGGRPDLGTVPQWALRAGRASAPRQRLPRQCSGGVQVLGA